MSYRPSQGDPNTNVEWFKVQCLSPTDTTADGYNRVTSPNDGFTSLDDFPECGCFLQTFGTIVCISGPYKIH